MPRSAYDMTPVAIPESRGATTPAITSSLDAEVDVEVLRTIPKQFTIEDEKTANWLIRKVTTARLYAERVKAWADQEARRAEREEHTLMFLFGRQIEAWVRAEVEKLNGKKKSIALPAGTVGFRTLAPKLVIDDENLVLSWARLNLPEAIVVTEKMSKSVINENSVMTGEIPSDGVHMEPAAERFFIK